MPAPPPTPPPGDTPWTQRPLLVFSCHEAWVYQLRLLARPMDLVVGLRGRPSGDAGWDARMRPVPPAARLIELPEALARRQPYGCIIAHNLTDLLDARQLSGPRLLVLHETLEGAALEQHLAVPLEQFRQAVARFVDLTAAHAVAVSPLKARSWGVGGEAVAAAADPADYLPWDGGLARGLRVANHILRRPRILRWEFHQQAFDGLPVTLVGHNPEMEGVRAAAGWEPLKQTFAAHRFYIHTADPLLEDGYNMAMLEAMAAGLPVLGNRHPTSPVEHGVSGFLSDDPAELRGYALQLLADRALAARLGAAARETVATHFSSERFRAGFGRAIEAAQRRWLASPHGEPAHSPAMHPPAGTA